MLFLVRFLPFWAIPVAFVFFEIGMHYHNYRDRPRTIIAFMITGICVISSLMWLFLEGYWRGPMFIKNYFG